LEKRITMKKLGCVKSAEKLAHLMGIGSILLKLNIGTKYQLYINTPKSLIIEVTNKHNKRHIK
jgi:hypothetical protein